MQKSRKKGTAKFSVIFSLRSPARLLASNYTSQSVNLCKANEAE